jgi:septum formation protein
LEGDASLKDTEQKVLILASSSPRRQELIRFLGLPYEIIVSDVDESVDVALTPAEMVETLSLRKASAVWNRIQATHQSGIIIGSDTIVVHEGEVMGKPIDEQDSERMLSSLQGHTHQVYSGIACIDIEKGKTMTAHRVTHVKMKKMQQEQIRRYIASGEPKDKAGSYAIQGLGATMVEQIEGDYFTVVGLPLNLLAAMLEEMGTRIL